MDSDNLKKFLEENFKAGEFAKVTLLVRLEDMSKFLDLLKSSNLNMVVMPGVQSKIDFESDDNKGSETLN